MTYTALYNHLLALGLEFNSRFEQPMLLNEVKAICRSIAKFCKTSPRYVAYTKLFSEKQAEKGRKGGLVSDSSKGGLARSASYDSKREQAKAMFVNGAKISAIATALDVHRNSVFSVVKNVCKKMHKCKPNQFIARFFVLASAELSLNPIRRPALLPVFGSRGIW